MRSQPRIGYILMPIVRILFLLSAGWFIWWSLRGRGNELRHGLVNVSAASLTVSLLLILAGLLCTGIVWLRILGLYQQQLPAGAGLRIFFLGQLGKYIPGSLWSFGAQAERAKRYDIPVRVTLGTSAVFLGFNISTAACAGFAVAAAIPLDLGLPRWSLVVLALAAATSMAPPVVRQCATMIAGRKRDLRLPPGDLFCIVGLMGAAWAAYTGAMFLLSPHAGRGTYAVLCAAFLLAYAAGVVVIFAPAGLGAREATFVALTAPVLGVGSAAAVALLGRVMFTVGDVLMAAGFGLTARWLHSSPSEKADSRS